jgi:DNA-binding NarL/FixJ family response regulator
VLIVETQPLLREGIKHVIEASADLTMVGEASSHLEAVELLEGLRPVVVVVGHAPPMLDAVNRVAALAALNDGGRLLILADELDATRARAAVGAGVHGWLSRSISSESLVAAILTCSRTGVVLPYDLARDLAFRDGMSSAPGSNHTEGCLSRRESEVLQLLAQDKQASTIATELFVSTATVRTHLSRIYSKLSVSGAPGAVAAAIRLGLID